MSAEKDAASAGDLTTDHSGAEGDHAATGGDSYFRALVENALDIVQVVNRDGTIRYESPAVREMTGYGPSERGGASALNLLHEDDIPQARKAIYELTATAGSTVRMDVRLRHRDGSLRDVEVVLRNLLDDPVVSGLVVGVRDITERKQTEEDLRVKERALENSINAIAMTDMDGMITYVNRACMDLWGSPDKEELIGKPYMVLIESGEVVKDVAMAMAESQVWQGELAAKRKDGKEVRVQVATSLVKDERGDPIQTVSSFVDITERKRAEEEKQRLEEQLLLAGRLAAVGELAAGVAHELNNPLAAVQAFAQLLASRTDIDQTAKSDLETIYFEAQRATKITGNLLSFARRHKPEKRLVLLNEVVEKSLELHAYQMRLNGIEVFRDLDPELPLTMADPHQMHQVFVNIIRNAEQAMTKAHRGGELRVKTETAGEFIRITFSDNGPGISGGNSKSIFDPFFTTKDVGEGTGLGLSICYGIVEGHGGRIYARGKPGKGADFVVEIPILSLNDVTTDETSSTHTLVASPRFL